MLQLPNNTVTKILVLYFIVHYNFIFFIIAFFLVLSVKE